MAASRRFVEKVEKSSPTKTPQIAIRQNIAAQHHLRWVQDDLRRDERALLVQPYKPAGNVGRKYRDQPSGLIAESRPVMKYCNRVAHRGLI